MPFVPLPYKLAAVALAVALIASAAFWKGMSHVQSRWDKEKDTQTIENQKKELENDKTIMAVATAYSSESDRLRNKLRAMPKPTVNPCTIAESDGQRVGVSQDAFYANSMQCELQLKHIREWVYGVNIPVR